MYDEQGEYDKALADYDRAIALGKNESGTYFGRAATYYHKHDHSRALDDLDHIIALNPYHARAYFLRGAIYAELGAPAKVKSVLGKVTRTWT